MTLLSRYSRPEQDDPEHVDQVQEQLPTGRLERYSLSSHNAAQVVTRRRAAKRKNQWVCALKQALSDCQIYGPTGDPAAPPGVQHVTMVPFEPADSKVAAPTAMPEPLIPRGNYNLTDKNAVIADDSLDVYNERDELHMTNPRPTMPRPRVPGPSGPGMPQQQSMGQVPRTTGVTTPAGGYETIEMGPAGGTGYR